MKKKEITVKSPGTMMLYSTNNSIVKRLIEDREYNTDKSYEKRDRIINKFNFIGALLNGFISDGNNKVHLNLFYFRSKFLLIKNLI